MDDLPPFVHEQRRLANDPTFSAKLSEINQSIPPGKRRTLFISHAWNLPAEQDKYNEQYVDLFVKQLATDLSTLGFEVFLDIENAGVGVALNGTMEKGIRETDHVLLVLTNTYFYKVTERPWSGVSKELDYVIDRIDKMGGATAAGDSRFVLPFLLVPRIAGFSLVESYGGFAGTYLQKVGYENAVLDLGNKVYCKNIPLVERPKDLSDALKATKQAFAAQIKDHVVETDAVAEAMGGDAVLENVRSKGDQTVFAVDGRAAIFGGSSQRAHAVSINSTATPAAQAMFDKYRLKK